MIPISKLTGNNDQQSANWETEVQNVAQRVSEPRFTEAHECPNSSTFGTSRTTSYRGHRVYIALDNVPAGFGIAGMPPGPIIPIPIMGAAPMGPGLGPAIPGIGIFGMLGMVPGMFGMFGIIPPVWCERMCGMCMQTCACARACEDNTQPRVLPDCEPKSPERKSKGKRGDHGTLCICARERTRSASFSLMAARQL